MDVEDAVGKTSDGLGAENPHEPGQDQRLSPRHLGRAADLAGELGPITSKGNNRGRDRGSLGTIEGTTPFDVADEQPKARDLVVDEGLEVGTGAAGENREFDSATPLCVEDWDRWVGDGSGLRWTQ